MWLLSRSSSLHIRRISFKVISLSVSICAIVCLRAIFLIWPPLNLYSVASSLASSSLNDGIIDFHIAHFASVVGALNSTLYRKRRSKALSIFAVRLVVAINMPSKVSISCRMIFCRAFSILSTERAMFSVRLLIIASASLKRSMGAIFEEATVLR